MTRDRHLAWSGCFNARDLGGLTNKRGLEVRRGAVVRADGLDLLTGEGWDAVFDHGVRTIVDLRNDDERALHASERPEGLTTIHLPLDGVEEDKAFFEVWGTGWQFGTPMYYGPHLERFPHRSAAVLRAIAHAPEGGVVFHCSAGRDRTGLITMLLLTLLDFDEETIAEDYLLSIDRVAPLFERRREPDQRPFIEEFLKSKSTTLRETLRAALASFDRARWQREGGFTDDDLMTLRARVLRSSAP